MSGAVLKDASLTASLTITTRRNPGIAWSRRGLWR
jgi:hypothetical protein